MVTDRRIEAYNGRQTVLLTRAPFYVTAIKGFDRLTVQNVTVQGSGQDGASVVSSYVVPRDMEISGQIRADTPQGMQGLRNQLLELFLPNRDILITHSYGGSVRTVTVRVERSPAFRFTSVSSIQEYDVALTAASPYWTDRDETEVDIAETAGRFCFPLAIPEDGAVFGVKSSSAMAMIYNASPIKVGMRYMFVANGKVVNPQLFNVKTRKYMRLLCEMEAGESISVQSGNARTIMREYRGMREDYIGRIDLAGGGATFLELEPGDNLFRHIADEGEDMLEVRMSYRNVYPGV